MPYQMSPWCTPKQPDTPEVLVSPDPYFNAPIVTGLENRFGAKTYQRTMPDVKRAIDDARRSGIRVWSR